MTDLLRRHLTHRVDELFRQHSVVVWHDDSGTLGPLLRETLPAGVEMPEFEGNPLSVRSAIDIDDPWLEHRWLLYVPELQGGVHSEWLTDHEQAFCVLRQANLLWAFEQFFHVPASPSLRALLRGPAARTLASRFGQYFPGRDTLEEEDVVFALLRATIDAPAATATDLLLRYLTSEADVGRWEAQELLPALTSLVKTRLGLQRNLVDGQPPDRAVVGRCLVASALVESGAAEARAMANYLPREETRPQWAAALDQGLRDTARRGPLASAIAEALEGSKLIGDLTDPLRLARGPALPLIDARLLDLLLHDRAAGDESWWDAIVRVADERARAMSIDEKASGLWAALGAAASLLRAVRGRSNELLAYPPGAFDRLAIDYVRPDTGDWRIDQLYRFAAHADRILPPVWSEALVRPAVEAYHRFARELAARFVQAMATRAEYGAPGFLRHRAFWSELVDPTRGKAVLIVDALRADLAHDLGRRLQAQGHRVEHRFVLAELPARTEIGMVALLPRAQQDFAVRVEGGHLVPSIEGKRVPGTTERVKYLEAVCAQHGVAVRREDVETFLRDDGKLIDECRARGIVPIAHTLDVDEGGEIAARVTFELFDGILERCALFVTRAIAAGFTEIVVATDHGFLVRDPDAAAGGVRGTAGSGGGLARGLRYAVGTGEIGVDLVRLPAAVLGRGGDDVYVPRDTRCLAVQGGPGLFVHGGLSPQECALVFLRVTPGVMAGPVRPNVMLRAPERVTALAFPVSVVVAATDRPLLIAAIDTLVVVDEPGGSRVWALEVPLALRAGAEEIEHRLTITLPRGGNYIVAVVDVSTEARLVSHSLRVEVLGDDFTF